MYTKMDDLKRIYWTMDNQREDNLPVSYLSPLTDNAYIMPYIWLEFQK